MIKYGERFYRDLSNTHRWKTFRVREETTDLFIRTKSDHSKIVKNLIIKLRKEIRDHIEKQPSFLTSFCPIDRIKESPEVITKMYLASEAAGVGPMAAVAGAIADIVGNELMNYSDEVIVENGGDIWLRVNEPAVISIFAGSSPFSGRVGLYIYPEKTPMGICTSSGRIGHSTSTGKADASTILGSNAALADAVATMSGNMVNSENDLKAALNYANSIKGILGAVIIFGDNLSAQGDIELVDPGETNIM